MTLKSAAFLAFVGTLLLGILLIFDVIHDVVSAIGGLIPGLAVLKSFIYAFAGIMVAVFFYVFHRAQD